MTIIISFLLGIYLRSIIMAFKKSIFVVGIVSIAACTSGKGGFELDDVNIPQTQSKVKKLQDVETPPRTEEQLTALTTPTMGAYMELVSRDYFSKEGTVSLKSENFQSTELTDMFEGIEYVFMDKLDRAQGTSNEYVRLNWSINSEKRQRFWNRHELYSHSFQNPKFYGSRDRSYMRFVKSGWVADLQPKLYKDDRGTHMTMHGYVFYQGREPAKFFPSQNVTYKGTWDFMTDAKVGRNSASFNGEYRQKPSDLYSAFSYHESTIDDGKWRSDKAGDVSHNSLFTVDFASKTLSGNLYRNKSKSERIHRYEINAKLHGNRFRGNAVAVDKSDAYFGSDSNSLEGGFFGTNAEELGGQFLANDGSLFAVFSARQYKKDTGYDAPEKNVTRAFDAVKLSQGTYEKTEMDTFGNATKLVVGNRIISLLPQNGESSKTDIGEGKQLVVKACCSNLSFAKFGSFHTTTETVSEGSKQMGMSDSHYFFTGERTARKEMDAQSGRAEYRGTWEAKVATVSNSNGFVTPDISSSRAEFSVDFGAKSVTGKLYQNDAAKPTILITDGKIQENGFSARFKSGESGFVLDRAGEDKKVMSLNGTVTGGFYGPQAVELGGYLNSDTNAENRVVGVFGARKQQ